MCVAMDFFININRRAIYIIWKGDHDQLRTMRNGTHMLTHLGLSNRIVSLFAVS